MVDGNVELEICFISLLGTKFPRKSSGTSTLTQIHVLSYKSAKVITGGKNKKLFRWKGHKAYTDMEFLSYQTTRKTELPEHMKHLKALHTSHIWPRERKHAIAGDYLVLFSWWLTDMSR